MEKFAVSCLALTALATQVSSFSPQPTTGSTRSSELVTLSLTGDIDIEDSEFRHGVDSRADFLRKSSSIVAAAASLSLLPIDSALARGRATLEQAYERYSARIIGGGTFYKTKLKTLIAKDDWAGIQAALQEPPKKTKADRTKIDGGIQERAAQAGQFSDARVLTALDLLAAQFSDNSISPKTKAMKKDVDEIRSVINEMSSICRQAQKKGASKKELSSRMKELYTIGGTAWNRYAFVANEGIPKTVQQLPFL